MSQEKDKLLVVKEQVNDLQEVMIDNVGKVIERGEKVDDLLIKSDNLDQRAVHFKRETRRLKRLMCWKNIKRYLIIFVIFVVILIIILWAAGAFK